MADEVNRERLPIPDREHAGTSPFDAKDPAAVFPPIEPLRPPARDRGHGCTSVS